MLNFPVHGPARPGSAHPLLRAAPVRREPLGPHSHHLDPCAALSAGVAAPSARSRSPQDQRRRGVIYGLQAVFVTLAVALSPRYTSAYVHALRTESMSPQIGSPKSEVANSVLKRSSSFHAVLVAIDDRDRIEFVSWWPRR
jgi:hypothetical protein